MARAALWLHGADVGHKVAEVAVAAPAVFAVVGAFFAALVHDVPRKRRTARAVVGHKVAGIRVRHAATDAIVAHGHSIAQNARVQNRRTFAYSHAKRIIMQQDRKSVV